MELGGNQKKVPLARSLPFYFQSCFLKLGFSKSYERTNRVVVCGTYI
jgi:hypothetical protein